MSDFKKKLPSANMGITTIITVFLVLSLITFASLSYVNAKNDYNLSKQVAIHNDQYYEASNKANIQIADTLKSIKSGAVSQEKYNFEYPVGDSHKLYVTIIPSLDSYRITRFEISATSSWNGDGNILTLQTFGNN